MPLFRVQLQGKEQLLTALDQFENEVKAPRQMWVNLVSDVIAPHMAERFAQRGPGWAQLSPAYAEWKAVHFPGKPLLVRSEAMKRALTDASRFGGQQSQIGPNTLNLAPKGIAYFATHQLGTRRMPARPMIDLQALRAPVGAYIEHWLTTRARDFGWTVRG